MTQPRVFRIGLTNATLVSSAYLLFSLAIEAIRRIANPGWAERMSLALERFPAWVLYQLGLLEPLRQAFVYGGLTNWGARVVLGLTAVAVIFALGLGVSAAMWAVLEMKARFAAR